jgi:hypothetical protein
MADFNQFNPEQLGVTPTALQNGILAAADDSLKVWKATLPFPGWLWTPESPPMPEVSYPIVDLFAYTDHKFKKSKIYLQAPRGFEDLKTKLLSTCHANGSRMTYRGGRVKMLPTLDAAAEAAAVVVATTPNKRTKKHKEPPKYRFACSRGRVYRPEQRPEKLKNRQGGMAVTRKTGTTYAKTAGDDTCSCKFSIAEDTWGYYFCCGLGSSDHQYHVKVDNGSVSMPTRFLNTVEQAIDVDDIQFPSVAVARARPTNSRKETNAFQMVGPLMKEYFDLLELACEKESKIESLVTVMENLINEEKRDQLLKRVGVNNNKRKSVQGTTNRGNDPKRYKTP